MKVPFKDVQYVFTHQCKLAEQTNYCDLSKVSFDEPRAVRIREAVRKFKEMNLEVKVLGGNALDHRNFYALIEEMNNLGLKYVITDNAMDVQSLIHYKVKGVMFSLDTLGETNIGGCSYIKSVKAVEAIKKLSGTMDYLGVNTVLHNRNLDEIPKMLEFTTEHKAVMNICPLMQGEYSKFMFRVPTSEFAIRPEHRDKVVSLARTLLGMKRSGYLIGCPEEYLEMLPGVLASEKRYNWDCKQISSIPVLRVAPDLGLIVCSDIEGVGIRRYSVFDLPEKFDEINTAWLTDFDRHFCCNNFGCFWSNVVIAEIYRRQGLGTLTATGRNL